jgi:hypothetical protein
MDTSKASSGPQVPRIGADNKSAAVRRGGFQKQIAKQ